MMSENLEQVTDKKQVQDENAEKAQDARKKLADLVAPVSIRPTLNAGQCIKAYDPLYFSGNGIEDIDYGSGAIANVLCDKIDDLEIGNLKNIDAMLLSQAYALQSIFTSLAISSKKSQYLDTSERYLRMALKAQAQCTRTLEVLGNLKSSPSAATVNQNTNIGQAVQVNNMIQAPSAPAEKPLIEGLGNLNSTNELLEALNEQWMDNRSAETPITINTELEALGALNRPHN